MSFGWTALPSPGTEQWLALSSIVGCPGEEDQEDARLECLKAKPMDDLINGMLTGELTFSPSFDGVTALPGGGKAWKEGNAVKVPILTGTMAEEGTVLIAPNATMEEFLGAYLPAPPFTEEMVQGIVGVYRADARLESDFDVMAALYSDFLFKCVSPQPTPYQGFYKEYTDLVQPQTMLATAASAHQPTYLYYGNFTATNFLGPELAWLGKFHGAEMFLMYASPTDERHTPSSRALTNTLRGIFARFARNPGNGPGWDPVNGEDNTAKDLAVIGDVGSEETSGLAMRTRGEAGTGCEIYAEIYAAMEQIPG
jgi:acetylcholinesterase